MNFLETIGLIMIVVGVIFAEIAISLLAAVQFQTMLAGIIVLLMFVGVNTFIIKRLTAPGGLTKL